MKIKCFLLWLNLLLALNVYAAELQDPTQPAQVKVKKTTIDPQSLKVYLIKKGSDFNVAVLNGEIVFQGSNLENLYIKEITSGKVILQGSKEETIQLNLWGNDKNNIRAHEKDVFVDIKIKH